MKSIRLLMFLALVFPIGYHANANATTVNASITASVNDIFPGDPFGVSIGTQVIVNASYESDATDLLPALPNLGRYSLNTLSFSIDGGSPFVLTNGLELETLLDQPLNDPNFHEFDRIAFSSGNNSVGGLLGVRLVFARVADYHSLLLTRILPPTSLPDGIDYEFAQLRIVGSEPGTTGGGFDATIDSFTLSPIPVPAAIWLFASGLVGLIEISRRRKS